MARVPKYIDNLIDEEKSIDRGKKAVEEYSIIKKLNKSNNYQILSLIMKDHRYKDQLRSLYRSNRSYSSWLLILELTKYKSFSDDFFVFLKIILKTCDTFLEFEKSVQTLKTILLYQKQFVRPISEWSPKSRNSEQQVKSLIRHLFAKYPAPSFLEKYFYDDRLNYGGNEEKNRNDAINMYIHMGGGNSMKSYNGYPIGMVIHKKAAHHLYSTPDNLSFIEALRRIQVIYLGGDKYIFEALMRSQVLKERVSEIKIKKNGSDVWEVSTEEDEFWISVMKFFIDNTMIESDKISEIIDYINNMKFLEQRTNVDGRYVTVKPPHPTFSMKGRTPLSLLNQSDQWHYERDRLNRVTRRMNSQAYLVGKDFKWIGSPINDGLFGRGKHYKYKVVQLCSYYELRDEGKEMHHCVATYATSCSSGKCSIFSVREYIDDHFNGRTATLEIRNGSIVQIRSKYNKKPDDTTVSVIKEWANYEKLTISQYAL